MLLYLLFPNVDPEALRHQGGQENAPHRIRFRLPSLENKPLFEAESHGESLFEFTCSLHLRTHLTCTHPKPHGGSSRHVCAGAVQCNPSIGQGTGSLEGEYHLCLWYDMSALTCKSISGRTAIFAVANNEKADPRRGHIKSQERVIPRSSTPNKTLMSKHGVCVTRAPPEVPDPLSNTKPTRYHICTS